MRQIRILAHMSLDGVIQPPGDGDFANGGWTAPHRSAAGAEALVEAQGKPFDLLLGHRTYDMWSSHWPKVKGGPFADALNAATKYVATHRPDGLEWARSEASARTSSRVFAASIQRTAPTWSSGAVRP